MSLVAVGDNVTDCYLDMGQLFPGGNCVNVAVHVARAGTPSAYVGAVGDDERGDLLRSSMATEGVDVSRVRVAPGDTSLTVVRHVAGDRVFGPTSKGVRVFTPTAEELEFVARFDVAHVSYCSDLEDVVPEVAARTRVSFDFDDRVHTDWAETLLPHVWVAAFSTSHLTTGETADVVRWAHDRGAQWVLATRGADGAVVSDGADVVTVTPEPIVPVDTLGAGDAFIGRALHGVLAGEPAAVLATAAMGAGTAACGHLGGYGHGVPLRRIHLGAAAATLMPGASTPS